MKFIFSKKIKARDPVTGKFEGINAFAAESTEEYLNKIQKKGEDTLTDVEAQIEQKGAETLATIPEDYTELTNEVDQLSEKLNYYYTFKSAFATEIPINSNLDSYLSIGNYKVMSREVASTIANIPVAAGGRLFVMATFQNTRLIQRYEASTIPVSTYNRYFNGTEWSEWCRLAIEKDFEICQTLSNDKCVKIDSNANLDDYLTEGNYKITSSADAKTITNMPYPVAGRLTVMSTSMPGRYIQRFEANTSTPRIYVRFYDGSSWGDWAEIATKADVSATIKSTNIMLTSSNYTSYFTDFNDIPVNTIYNIGSNVPLLNAPRGTTVIGYTTMKDNVPAGTILTYSGSVTNPTRQRFQLYTGSTSSIPQSIMWFRSAYQSGGNLYWSEWQRISEASAITSSNIVLSKEHAHNFFTDLNDAPLNTIYQIDRNCTEGVLANHPMPGESCILLTTGFSFTSRHGMIQMCFGLKEGCSMYFRYGFKESTDTYMWTEWKKTLTESETSDYLKNMGRLPDGSDLNDITDNCFYLSGENSGNQNTPTQKAGFITSKTVGNITLHTYETLNGGRYSRYAVAGEWTEWVSG